MEDQHEYLPKLLNGVSNKTNQIIHRSWFSHRVCTMIFRFDRKPQLKFWFCCQTLSDTLSYNFGLNNVNLTSDSKNLWQHWNFFWRFLFHTAKFLWQICNMKQEFAKKILIKSQLQCCHRFFESDINLLIFTSHSILCFQKLYYKNDGVYLYPNISIF